MFFQLPTEIALPEVEAPLPQSPTGCNLRDYIKRMPALRLKGMLNIDELSPRVRQALRLDRLLLAAPIRRQRVRHLDWLAQLRATRLQQLSGRRGALLLPTSLR